MPAIMSKEEWVSDNRRKLYFINVILYYRKLSLAHKNHGHASIVDVFIQHIRPPVLFMVIKWLTLLTGPVRSQMPSPGKRSVIQRSAHLSGKRPVSYSQPANYPAPDISHRGIMSEGMTDINPRPPLNAKQQLLPRLSLPALFGIA